MSEFNAPWQWGKGWEEATLPDGALALGEDLAMEMHEKGEHAIKYADLQLFDAAGNEIIPIRIDHFDVIFDGDRIEPKHRRLIAAAPDLLAACECQEAREQYDMDGSGFTLPEADAVFRKHGFAAMLSRSELATVRQAAIAKARGT